MESEKTEAALSEALVALLDVQPSDPCRFFAIAAATRLLRQESVGVRGVAVCDAAIQARCSFSSWSLRSATTLTIQPSYPADAPREDESAYLASVTHQIEALITSALASSATSPPQLAAHLLHEVGLTQWRRPVSDAASQASLPWISNDLGSGVASTTGSAKLSVPERMAEMDRLYSAMVIQKAERGRACRQTFFSVVASAVVRKRLATAAGVDMH
jgi:hypothetical protein